MGNLKNRIKNLMSNLFRKYLLPVLLPMSFICSIFIIYQLSDKIITVSGICGTTENLTTLKKSLVVLKKVDRVNKSIVLSEIIGGRKNLRCQLENIEIKSLIYRALKISELIPEKDFILIDKNETLIAQVAELKKDIGSYIAMTGECSDKDYHRDVFYLTNTRIRGNMLYLELTDSNKKTILCEYSDQIIYNIVSKEYYVDYKIKNNKSLFGENIVFSSRACVSEDKAYRNLYRLGATVLQQTEEHLILSVPKIKANLKCKLDDIQEISPVAKG